MSCGAYLIGRGKDVMYFGREKGGGLGIEHEAGSLTVSGATPSVHLATRRTFGREHGRFSQGDAAPKGA